MIIVKLLLRLPGFTSCLNLINSYKGCVRTYHSWEGFAYTGLVINRESMKKYDVCVNVF